MGFPVQNSRISSDIYFIHNEREFEALTSMDYNKFDEIRLMNNLDFKKYQKFI